jgi:signal transduction histidine kinase
LSGTVDGVMLFDVQGAVHGGAARESSPLRRWEQLPPEAEAAVRGGPQATFGMADHRFELRPAYAGTDRVGVLVLSRAAEGGDARDAALADALSRMIAQILHSGFGTWVTSELHLATSESQHRAISQKNDELERAVQHLRELDQLKSNFLATVSHELRTPLTSVIGFSEMLLEGLAGALNDEQAEYVRTILDRGEELLELITQILEMSQLEFGALRLDLQRAALPELADRAIEAVRLHAAAAKVELINAIEGVPAVLVDPDKMQRVLVNLLGNAVKFSQAGSVRITAGLAPIRRPFREETLFGEEDSDAVRVTVTDTGMGIAPEQLSKVFEAFYQVDASPTRRHGGAGLGLSIVKNLVRAHGGEVWAESQIGLGTAVHFTVPLAATPEP